MAPSRRSWWIGAMLALAWSLAPGVSRACFCRPPPVERFLPGDGAHLPSNARGVTFFSSYRRTIFECEPPFCDPEMQLASRTPLPSAGDFRVQIVNGSRYEAVPFVVEPVVLSVRDTPGYRYADELLVAPRGGMRPGATYRFEGPGAVIHVFVDKEPLRAGTRLPLRVSDPVRMQLSLSHPAACSVELDAETRTVSVDLPSPDWASALWFATLVDGAVWSFRHDDCDVHVPRSSWMGPGLDLLFEVCYGKGDISAGFPFEGDSLVHTVQMVAVLPGTNVRLESEVVTFGEGCAQPKAVETAPKTTARRAEPIEKPREALPPGGACGSCRAGASDAGRWGAVFTLALLVVGGGRRFRRPCRPGAC
ncbi:hypothetical protein [Polyangium sp. 6x1]|uniref:hypothetical protein n=1 Tax=Polyangium sp. 6x1 TaxID=3042689 RepID=UPI002482B53C|nr:hypothetical protein [Polyangium sp. 6x1]MDI1443001.1 hypothetical protein [Polyangium sp. 6x1]